MALRTQLHIEAKLFVRPCERACAYACVFAWVCACVHMRMCICLRMLCVCMYVCVCLCVCVYARHDFVDLLFGFSTVLDKHNNNKNNVKGSVQIPVY